jgi:hypothetical protein
MKLEELLETHTAAGERYTQAANELHLAFVELASLDEVCGRSGYDGSPNVRTFVGMIQNLGPFMHPLFAPTDPAKCWREEVKARRDELLADVEEIAR